MAANTSRDRIVQAAIRLISAQGYRETTVGDIEAAAGLTRRAGGFYRHFASKEQVLVEAVRAMADEMIAGIRAEDIVALKSIRAELIVIARTMLSHARTYRPLQPSSFSAKAIGCRRSGRSRGRRTPSSQARTCCPGSRTHCGARA